MQIPQNTIDVKQWKKITRDNDFTVSESIYLERACDVCIVFIFFYFIHIAIGKLYVCVRVITRDKCVTLIFFLFDFQRVDIFLLNTIRTACVRER